MVSECVFAKGWEHSAVGWELLSHLEACENTCTDNIRFSYCLQQRNIPFKSSDKNLQAFNLKYEELSLLCSWYVNSVPCCNRPLQNVPVCFFYKIQLKLVKSFSCGGWGEFFINRLGKITQFTELLSNSQRKKVLITNSRLIFFNSTVFKYLGNMGMILDCLGAANLTIFCHGCFQIKLL